MKRSCGGQNNGGGTVTQGKHAKILLPSVPKHMSLIQGEGGRFQVKNGGCIP